MSLSPDHNNNQAIKLTGSCKQARFACLRCAARRHFVSARGSLRSPGVTLVNYKGDNISEYVCPTVIIEIARKITKIINF